MLDECDILEITSKKMNYSVDYAAPFGFQKGGETEVCPGEDGYEDNYGGGRPMTAAQLRLMRKIREEREEKGLYVENTNQEFEDHPMVGTHVVIDGKKGFVEKVNRQWYDGWYWCFLLNFDGSHGMRFVYNENCELKEILAGIKDFQEEVDFVDVNHDYFEDKMEQKISNLK